MNDRIEIGIFEYGKIRDAEERRTFREALARSSLGCPTGDCDHSMGQHVGDGMDAHDRWINPQCAVPGCRCPYEDDR